MARVLVVEDDREIRDLISLRLLMAGHSVLALADALAALDTVGKIGAPDVYVLDVGLPDLDGFRLLGRLREVGQGAPTVFLSAHAQLSQVELGAAMGARYLTKPFATKALMEAIDEVLTGRAAAVRATLSAQASGADFRHEFMARSYGTDCYGTDSTGGGGR